MKPRTILLYAWYTFLTLAGTALCIVVLYLVFVIGTGLMFPILKRIIESRNQPLAPVLSYTPPIAPVPAPKPEPEDTSPPTMLDVDAMGARMPEYQEIYQRVRDQGLQALAAEQNAPTDQDDREKMFIRLWAYLCVWDDFYKENLWNQIYHNDLWILKHGGPDTPLIWGYAYRWNIKASSVEGRPGGPWSADELNGTAYPPEFKLESYNNLINYFVQERAKARDGTPLSYPCFKTELPQVIQKWASVYQLLIQEKIPHDLLYKKAADLLYSSDQDEDALTLEMAAIDQAFQNVDPDNPIRLALKGAGQADDAWCARGNGYANTVTQDGWQQFNSRLLQAQDTLQAAYSQYPHEGSICRAMMRVCLGLGLAKDQEELWFQRAITINPNDYDAYWAKAWYLEPRWYGSVDDEIAFDQQCLQTQNWSAKIPMILIPGIADLQDDSVPSRPEVWTALEQAYRGYLEHYPESVYFRTCFAQEAEQTGHDDVAREQLKILGDKYDRDVMSSGEHDVALRAAGVIPNGP